MHRATTRNLTAGTRLARTVYGDHGELLLARGVPLTPRQIQALQDRGYQSVFVMDGIADDVEPVGLISDQLRSSAVANVRSAFDLIRDATGVARDKAARAGAPRIVTTHVSMAVLENQLSKMVSLAEAILNEVLDQSALAGMASLKAHDNYTFEHCVEVSVYGAMLGQRLGLSRSLLKDLVLGCLLHDIGKQYIDERIIRKPGKLTDDEFQQVMQHPLLGFQLVRQMPLDSPRPAHIVLQHHERQDGDGYPNRLFGTNRVVRTDQERFDPRRISLMAEIAAVVDVYSALASDRPYRAALPAHAVFAIMRADAGEHLNVEIMRSFLTLVQHFPIATHVRVSGGNYDGCLGVVVGINAQAPARPRVRLVIDARGRSMGDGDEIDMRQQPPAVDLIPLPDTSTLGSTGTQTAA